MKEEEKEEVSHSSLSKDSCRDRKRFCLASGMIRLCARYQLKLK